MKKKFLFLIVCVSLFLLSSCKKEQTKSVTTKVNALTSFNQVKSKKEIINYVTKITTKGSTSFVPVKDRIAVFDNDGTLWVEQPLPSQVYFAIDRIKELAKTGDFNWEKQFPFSAIIENDSAALKKIGKKEVIQIVGKAHATNTVEDLDSLVKKWLQTAKHPVLKQPYTNLVYQPMLEVIHYLKENKFKIFIVSGGSLEFMRVWAPEIYGIDKDRIIGSTFKTQPKIEEENIEITQTETFDFNDDHEGKVIAINKFIGQKPIMIFGNSDGDLEMMEYATTNNPYTTLMVYLNHTDKEREFYYTSKMLAGTLVKGMEVAKTKNWTIIDMKNDWKTVFPYPEK